MYKTQNATSPTPDPLSHNFMKRLCMTFQHSETCSGVVAYFAVNIWKEFEACINWRYRKPKPPDEWKDHYIIAALLSPNTRYSVSQTNEYESYKQVFRSSLVLPDVPATHSTLPIRRRRTFEPISLAAVLESSFAAVLPEYTEAPLDESIHTFLDLFITDKNQSGLFVVGGQLSMLSCSKHYCPSVFSRGTVCGTVFFSQPLIFRTAVRKTVRNFEREIVSDQFTPPPFCKNKEL